MVSPSGPLSGSEHQHQAAYVEWARLQAARRPALRRLFAVGNGGLRMKATAGKLRAEGVVAGVPDLLCHHRRSPWIGFAVEMKRPREAGRGINAATDEQREWLAALAEEGFLASVAFGFDAAMAMTEFFFDRDLTRACAVQAVAIDVSFWRATPTSERVWLWQPVVRGRR